MMTGSQVNPPFQRQYNLVRQFLLDQDPEARNARDSWSCGGSSYCAYRSYLQSMAGLGGSQRIEATTDAQRPTANSSSVPREVPTEDALSRTPEFPSLKHVAAPKRGLATDTTTTKDVSTAQSSSSTPRFTAADLANMPATAKYAFEGLSDTVEQSRGVAVTAVSFAPLSAEAFAFANAAGSIWIVDLAPLSGVVIGCSQLPPAHRATVCAIDWSFDASQLLSIGVDGSLALWATRRGAQATPPHSISNRNSNNNNNNNNNRDFGIKNVGGGGVDDNVSKPRLLSSSSSSSFSSLSSSSATAPAPAPAAAPASKASPVCMRTIKNARAAFYAGKFHPANPSLAVVATSAGCVEIYNCSSGMLQTKCSVFGVFEKSLPLTALDCSLHHVFVGDNAGTLHLLHFQRLSAAGADFRLTVGKHRLRLNTHHKPAASLPLPPAGPASAPSFSNSSATSSAGALSLFPPAAAAAAAALSEMAHSQPSAAAAAALLDLESAKNGWQEGAVTRIEYVPFCRMTGSAVLAVTLRDGSISIVRLNEAQHMMELHLKRQTPSPALWLSASICPLSGIQDTPLFTFASYDGSVNIYDPSAVGVTRGAHGSVHCGSGGNALAPPPPATVTVLHQHRAAAVATAWSFDESLLVSADVEGQVFIWKRSKLL